MDARTAGIIAEELEAEAEETREHNYDAALVVACIAKAMYSAASRLKAEEEAARLEGRGE